MNGGIYLIKNTVNGRVYVGSAIDFKVRWKQHRSQLNRGLHHSISLQRAWVKYGHEAFEFQIVEHVDDKVTLIEREQRWIDHFESYRSGYNTSAIARAAMLGKKHSPEAIQKIAAASKISNARADLKAMKSAMFKGVPRSELTRQRMSENHHGFNPMKGRKHKPETIEKMRMSAIQREEKKRENSQHISGHDAQ